MAFSRKAIHQTSMDSNHSVTSSTASTIRPSTPTQDFPSYSQSRTSSPRRDLDRPRSSSFSDLTPRAQLRQLTSIDDIRQGSVTPQPTHAGTRDRKDSVATIATVPYSRPLMNSSVSSITSPNVRSSPLRSTNSFTNVHISPPPLVTSPSLTSISASSVNTSAGKTFTSSAFDSRLMSLAMDKLENPNNTKPLEVKLGELGLVGAVGHGGDDAWQTVCVKTLPLWNGEGVKGFIEDLNDLVVVHIKRIIERAPNNAIAYLTEHVIELLAIGMLTLNAKLQNLTDDKLLLRVLEVWTFFFAGVLPYLEAIFLPFSTEPTLLGLADSKASSHERTQGTKPKITDGSSGINVRRLTLISFRDHLILPIIQRLEQLFVLHHQHGLHTGPSHHTQAKRLQMISILVSVQSEDENQFALEHLMRVMRTFLTPTKQYRPPSMKPTY